MPKIGEINYFQNIGEAGINHSINKPFSDPGCGKYLMDIGAIISLLPEPPAKLLDLGCGTGWTSCFFAKRGYKVIGQDISPDAIKYSNFSKEREKIGNLNFVTCDYEDMNFESEFDCAVFYDSLHHSVDEKSALEMVYKALKPGGICVICEPGKNHHKSQGSIEAMNKYNVTEREMPPNNLIKIAKELGFNKYKLYPQIIHTFKTVYEKANSAIVNKILSLSIMKSIVIFYLDIFKKYSYGILVLIK